MTTTTIIDPAADLDAFVARSADRQTGKSLGYRATRLMAGAFNQAQMGMAEAYINGLEIPDSLFRGAFHSIDAHPVPTFPRFAGPL